MTNRERWSRDLALFKREASSAGWELDATRALHRILVFEKTHLGMCFGRLVLRFSEDELDIVQVEPPAVIRKSNVTGEWDLVNSEMDLSRLPGAEKRPRQCGVFTPVTKFHFKTQFKDVIALVDERIIAYDEDALKKKIEKKRLEIDRESYL